MNIHDSAGEMLFFRFAYPCAESRLERGQLDPEHYERLVRLAGGEDWPWPPHRIRHELRYCFPHAYRRHREFVGPGRERWEWATVMESWRDHHGHYGPCAIHRGEIALILSPNLCRVAFGGRTSTCLNPYRLRLEPGEPVLTHHMHVVIRDGS